MNQERWLWIHGWGMSPRVWGDLPSSFPHAEHHYIDFSGCAKPVDFLDTAVAVLRAHPGPWTVVGWSMGALLAIEAAATMREPPRLIVFGGTLQFVSRDRTKGTPPRVLEAMQRSLERDPEATLAGFHSAVFGTVPRDSGDSAAAIADFVVQTDFSAAGLATGLQYLRASDVRDCWLEFAGDTLWIHGESDPICPVGGAPPGAVILPGAGHAPFAEQPERCIQEIGSFLHR